MKKRKKNKKFSLSEIIEDEIKLNGLREGFSKNQIKFAKNLRNKNSSKHIDLTAIPFITIDGEDSKDFDDAVWCDNNENFSKVMIAIADVSFYVKKNDPIDMEAKKRGNSFYFIDRVIPMLPEELSNDLCSLVPNKKRKSIVIEINLKDGIVKNFKVHRAIIKSVSRLTYEQVENIFLTKDKKNKNFTEISNLFKTYNILFKQSEKREKIFFDPDEFKIELDSKDEILLIKKKKLESYKLIEEFMVLANTVIAHYFKINKIYSIFRNHEKPKNDKTKLLEGIISQYKLKHSGKFNCQKDFNEIIKILKKKKISFLNEYLLKSQSRAIYDTENKGHFGLSLNNYIHFTSPIRRYSDLVAHRDLIDFYFFKKKTPKSEVVEHLNFQEKKADSIDRFIFDVAVSMYLKKFKRNEFKGFVDGIESFGIFIKAIDFPFSGLARFKFRDYNKKNNRKNIFQDLKIGQLVTFKIKKINSRYGKILLESVREFKNYEN